MTTVLDNHAADLVSLHENDRAASEQVYYVCDADVTATPLQYFSGNLRSLFAPKQWNNNDGSNEDTTPSDLKKKTRKGEQQRKTNSTTSVAATGPPLCSAHYGICDITDYCSGRFVFQGTANLNAWLHNIDMALVSSCVQGQLFVAEAERLPLDHPFVAALDSLLARTRGAVHRGFLEGLLRSMGTLWERFIHWLALKPSAVTTAKLKQQQSNNNNKRKKRNFEKTKKSHSDEEHLPSTQHHPHQRTIRCTGHSFGAAMATIFATTLADMIKQGTLQQLLHSTAHSQGDSKTKTKKGRCTSEVGSACVFKVELVTFGSPRVMSFALANYVSTELMCPGSNPAATTSVAPCSTIRSSTSSILCADRYVATAQFTGLVTDPVSTGPLLAMNGQAVEGYKHIGHMHRVYNEITLKNAAPVLSALSEGRAKDAAAISVMAYIHLHDIETYQPEKTTKKSVLSVGAEAAKHQTKRLLRVVKEKGTKAMAKFRHAVQEDVAPKAKKVAAALRENTKKVAVQFQEKISSIVRRGVSQMKSSFAQSKTKK